MGKTTQLSLLLTVSVGLYAINAALFGILTYYYGKTAYSTRAKYATGLFVFSLLLFAHSAGTASAYLFLGEYFKDQVVPFMAIMGTFEFAGVLALLRITL